MKTIENEQSMQDERTETEPPVEEGRKMKRNEDEKNEQEKEDQMDELVSNRAYEVMQNKMIKKDFIGERGFKQLIPPFKEVIEKIG